MLKLALRITRYKFAVCEKRPSRNLFARLLANRWTDGDKICTAGRHSHEGRRVCDLATFVKYSRVKWEIREIRHDICLRDFSQTTGMILIKFAQQVGTVMKGVAVAIWAHSSNIRA